MIVYEDDFKAPFTGHLDHIFHAVCAVTERGPEVNEPRYRAVLLRGFGVAEQREDKEKDNRDEGPDERVRPAAL